jgi:hypothetical protein
MSSKIISLILCSRNDTYMGNSRWRLETSINLALLNAKEANFLDKLEIIVSDWGSDIPLSSVLNLIPEAEKHVKFVHIPQDLATSLQGDSKFPEVIALNAAARRSTAQYIGRIDNDTIVGKEFFENFYRIVSDKLLWFDPTDAFMFIERRSIPYRFSSKSYSIEYVSNYIKTYGSMLKVETARIWGLPFWWSPVGIMIFHKDIWHNSRGYDEKLIYWGWMEGDLALRLGKKHLLIDFKDLAGNFLYHLEHYPSLTAYKDRNGPSTPRKKNKPNLYRLSYQENDEYWGVNKENIDLENYQVKENSKYLKYEKKTNPLGSIAMRFSFYICNSKRKIDLLRINSPKFIQSVIVNLKIKIGKVRKIFKIC